MLGPFRVLPRFDGSMRLKKRKRGSCVGHWYLCDGDLICYCHSNHDPQNKKAYAGRSRNSFMIRLLKMNNKKPSIRQNRWLVGEEDDFISR